MADQPALQEPYDLAAAAGRLRPLFGTGTLAGQEQLRRGYDEGRTTP
ncbi:hypothetical protein GGR88_000953 [Sphingomonas jejuensis]|uniref:Uncharacterized protein n=1 Tax=Sphingomonas jejuensis TaxID=904715 RepID=A0ABX0XJH1_9SPHN|nr:hypothetical protein [Sphingomonas jejuensis]NJC33479.1 hypothetical protein [Sphingomonas jejuensis]